MDRNLPEEGLETLVDALLDQIPEDSSGVVITVKAENAPPSPPSNGAKPQNSAQYDPGLVYILEFCTVLALRDEKSTELLGKRVVEALQAVLRDTNNYHPIIVARATFYLFRLLKATYVSPVKDNARQQETQQRLQEYDFIRAPVLLHSVSSFPKGTFKKTSQLVLQGLKLCIDEAGPLRNEIMTSPDFWAILRALAAFPDTAPVVFDILESGVSPSSTAIMADNYEAAIALLNDIASAAKVGAVKEQKLDRKQQQRKPRTPIKETHRYFKNQGRYSDDSKY